MAAGGKDKWPLHFYPALLMMRILGKDGLEAVYAGKNGGFNNPDVVKAFQLYKDFAVLQPFQKGYSAHTYSEAAGTFHDGKAAFHLMGTGTSPRAVRIRQMEKDSRTKILDGFSFRKSKVGKAKQTIFPRV